VGDGVHNDSEAFEKAVAAVTESGGRVFIPEGRYRLTRWLSLPPAVELCGVSAASSVLLASTADEGAVFETPPQGRLKKVGTLDRTSPMVWLRSGCALRSLTLDGTDAGAQERFALVLVGEPGKTCRDTALLDCRFLYSKPYELECRAIVISGGPGPESGRAGIVTDSLRVEGCEFAVNSICLQGIKDGRNVGTRVCRNTFTTVPPHGAHTLIVPCGSEGCLFESNVFESGGRTKTEQGPRPSAGNSTIQRNCWRLNIIRNGRKGDGETIMYETGSPGWYGKAKGATGDTLTALDTDRFWHSPDLKGAWKENQFAGGYCVIVDGRGLGQWAYVTGNTADTLKLDRPWRMVPDATTTFSVLGEGSVENVHVCNDTLFTAGWSGNYRTSLRNV
jgi:hypothetical protein